MAGDEGWVENVLQSVKQDADVRLPTGLSRGGKGTQKTPF